MRTRFAPSLVDQRHARDARVVAREARAHLVEEARG